jgi:hypothetical protein
MSLYVATESGTLTLSDGSTVNIYKDITRVREGHLALKEHAVFFKPADQDVELEYETATKAPDEKRKASVKTKASKG